MSIYDQPDAGSAQWCERNQEQLDSQQYVQERGNQIPYAVVVPQAAYDAAEKAWRSSDLLGEELLRQCIRAAAPHVVIEALQNQVKGPADMDFIFCLEEWIENIRAQYQK